MTGTSSAGTPTTPGVACTLLLAADALCQWSTLCTVRRTNVCDAGFSQRPLPASNHNAADVDPFAGRLPKTHPRIHSLCIVSKQRGQQAEHRHRTGYSKTYHPSSANLEARPHIAQHPPPQARGCYFRRQAVQVVGDNHHPPGCTPACAISDSRRHRLKVRVALNT